MLPALSQRLLPALQLTRMALVFTAISNSLCTYLLALRRNTPEETSLLFHIRPRDIILITMISIGLYGFGMSLNDIIDRRRDRQLAAHRPLPSGRIALHTAYFICISLALLALVASAIYSHLSRSDSPWMSLALTIWTGFLIAFYDLAGKYLVATGLLTLGLIRFFHAVIPAPNLPLLWHPLLLLTHVTVISAIAYAWEQKRPALTRLHGFAVIGGVGLIDILAVTIADLQADGQVHLSVLWPKPALALPLAAALAFVLLAWHIRRRSPSPREAGQALMLTGLLWLIVYDSAFAAAYVGPLYAMALLGLLPVSYLAVQLMRWWSKLILLSQQPTFQRQRRDTPGSPPGPLHSR